MVPVCAGKIFIARKYFKPYFQLILSKTRTFYLALSLFDDITSLTYFNF